MHRASYYREQAARSRRLSKQVSNDEVHAALLQLARDFDDTGGGAMPAKRVLLVEDDPLVHQLLAQSLRGGGYAVDIAATAADAWRCLGSGQVYALVIADWQLPDGDGIVIADAAADYGTKTCVISGYLLQMPIDFFSTTRPDTLMKPIRPHEIVTAVERSIGKAADC